MRVVQFLQVMVLFGVLGYALLVALVNPVTLHLPIPFVEREWLLPAGVALLWALGLGVAYGAFLLLPTLLRLRLDWREARAARHQAEENLQLTLKARLGLTESTQRATESTQRATAPATTAPASAQVRP